MKSLFPMSCEVGLAFYVRTGFVLPVAEAFAGVVLSTSCYGSG
jgi:hypothetical protein